MTNSELVKILQQALDGNPSLSRKLFLRTAAAATASGALACQGDSKGPVGPEEEVDIDPVAIIQGPTDLHIGKLGQLAYVNYHGGQSQPSNCFFTWTMEKLVDPLGAGEMGLGQGNSALVELIRPGEYRVKLKVVASGKEDFATHTTTVHPPPAPSQDYPLLAFLRSEEYPPGVGHSSARVLHLMDPADGSVVRIGGYPANGFVGTPGSWERGSTRLALESWRGSKKSVKIYDLLADELTDLVIQTDGPPMTPAWNPQKDWIAYAGNERGGSSEPTLIRPDGSEKLYLAGDQPSPEVSGYNLSWSPDGERLMVGWTPYDLTASEWPDWRNTLFSGFWTGDLEGVRIPAEDQLLAFLTTVGHNQAEIRETMNPGVDGLAWSPDGIWLAYTMSFWFPDGSAVHYLLKSRVDGTGDIEIVMEGVQPVGGSYAGMSQPFWSPDAEFIYFTGGSPTRVQKVPSSGGGASQVTDTEHDRAIAWYG